MARTLLMMRLTCRWAIPLWAIATLSLVGIGQAIGRDVNSVGVAQYGVGSWPEDGYGNHRAVLRVDESADAVWAHIPWRRRDKNPQAIDVRVYDMTTGKRVRNVSRMDIRREYADLVFQPQTVPGEYAVYYLPYSPGVTSYDDAGTYYPVEETADPHWLKKHKLANDVRHNRVSRTFQKANLVEIQARTAFDRFDPMEVPATSAETDRLIRSHADKQYLLFPETRDRMIRMRHELPISWIERGPNNQFAGNAQPGEYFVFQLGLFATAQDVNEVQLAFGSLVSLDGAEDIPSSSFVCINSGYADKLGVVRHKTFNVAKETVCPVWVGLQIPEDASGRYAATITIQPGNAPPEEINVALNIAGSTLPNSGDDDLWRMSRLRWLNSDIASDDDVLLSPFTPLVVDGDRVSCLNRSVTFSDMGFPISIVSNEKELLDRAVALNIDYALGESPWVNKQSQWLRRGPGLVERQYKAENKWFEFNNRVTMEFDGQLKYQITLVAKRDVNVDDIGLAVPFVREAVPYLMGMGKRGGYRPTAWSWSWDVDRADNMVWLGDVDAGLQLKLGESLGRELSLHRDGIPESWHNGGQGKCDITEDATAVLVDTRTGARRVGFGEKLVFEFRFLITPFKPINGEHWNWRVSYPWRKMIEGANIFHVHHSHAGNRFINYPFLNTDELAGIIRHSKKIGMGVDLYYTIRELSNHATELWALKALGDEVIKQDEHLVYLNDQASMSKAGGGYPWLREHLAEGYVPAWRKPGLPDGVTDAAIAINGSSRWNNYYLEGLDWLLKKTQFDGLYFDGTNFDRNVMKRIARIMERNNPDSRIYLHSGDNYRYLDQRISSANLDMEIFPYLDYLWYGEYFDYNTSPDYWLIEMSGLPFGLTGEALNHRDNVNPYRSMIYGMSCRLHESQPGMWKFWDQFGIQDAKMHGYWSADCPVKTDHPDVLATVYTKEGQTLISLASWANESRRQVSVSDSRDGAIQTDGVLRDAEWDEAARLMNFYKLKTTQLAGQQTQAYVTYDAEYLYVAFRCYGDTTQLRANEKRRDGKLWRDDSVELLIQPDLSKPVSIQFIGNSMGVFSDLRSGNTSWNANWLYKTSVQEGFWEGEIRVPLGSLGLSNISEGQRVGLNVCRNNYSSVDKHSSWSPVKTRYDDAAGFGRIALTSSKTSTREVAGDHHQEVSAGVDGIHLNVDWEALGIDPRHATLRAPAIEHFQDEQVFKVTDPIPVERGKGWLLILE